MGAINISKWSYRAAGICDECLANADCEHKICFLSQEKMFSTVLKPFNIILFFSTATIGMKP